MGVSDIPNAVHELDRLRFEMRRAGVAELPALLARIDALQARAAALGVPALNAAVRMRRADAFLRLGRPGEALEQTAAAREHLGDRRQQDLFVHLLALNADALAALGRTDELRRTCDEAIAIIESHRFDVGGPYLQSAYLSSRVGIYAHAVRAAFECGDQADLLAKAELSKARILLRRGEHARVSQDLRDQFHRACREVDRAAAAGRLDAPTLHKRRVLAELIAAERTRGSAAPTFDLDALRRALPPDRAAISYYWLDRTTLLISVVDSKGAVTESRTLTPADREALEELAESILTFGATSARTVPGRVSKWSEVLWPSPSLRPRLEGRRLYITPHRILHALPLHAMTLAGRFIAELHPITYVPNLTCLIPEPPAPAAPSTLAVGASEFVRHDRTLDPLPNAALEVRSVGAIYARKKVPFTPLLNSPGTEDELRRLDAAGELARFSCLHFSLHGENVDPDSPMEAALHLYDSELHATEIADLRLGADVVVLSACCSGQRPFKGRGLQELPGDDVFGLQAAFFAAGARSLVCNLWPVEDNVARALMSALHERLADGAAPDLALHAAQCEYLARAESFLDRDAYFWACFMLAAAGRIG